MVISNLKDKGPQIVKLAKTEVRRYLVIYCYISS